MAAEDQRTTLASHDHPEFEDMEKPWQHEHDGQVHMHGAESEDNFRIVPALDSLVKGFFPDATIEVKVDLKNVKTDIDPNDVIEMGQSISDIQGVDVTVWTDRSNFATFEPYKEIEPRKDEDQTSLIVDDPKEDLPF